MQNKFKICTLNVWTNASWTTSLDNPKSIWNIKITCVYSFQKVNQVR